MAFLQSAPPREPFLQAPGSVLGLIAVLAVAHVVRILLPAPWPDTILTDFAFIPARAGAGDYAGFALSFVSYIFVHVDFTHLGINCLWLLAFGPIVARRFGAVRFLAFFLACGIAGAVAAFFLIQDVSVAIIGASGAISGLMAAGIRLYPWPGVVTRPSVMPILSRPILLFSGTWLIANMIFGYFGYGGGGTWQPIAWQAHLGGYLCGLIATGRFVPRSSHATG